MYLKSITLKGFKSFAAPTTLRFERGITCVVGPNGSGKSNVVDALAWVMGEQGAKSLRGGKMEDVIFAGTSGRAPLGRAEVAVTIDNADNALPIDYAEVTISRILFRNGQSEYQINGETARLLDIQELLSDSGIGREMHVIVGQGQLDAILTANHEERRGFIEEAAGVLKHRKRREKALRKLESMQGNLARIQDLTVELRRQLRPLGKQAEVAKKATTIQADVRDAKLRLLAEDLLNLQATLNAEVADEDSLRARKTNVDMELDRLRNREVDLDRISTIQNPEITAAQENYYNLTAQREKLRGLQNLASERAKYLTEEAEEVRTIGRDPVALDEEARGLRAEEEVLLKTLTGSRTELERSSNNLSELESLLKSEEDSVAAALRGIADLREGTARQEGHIKSLQSRIESGNAEITRLSKAKSDAEARAEEARAEFAELESEISGLGVGELHLDSTFEKAKAELAAAKLELDNHISEQIKAERERGAADAALDALRQATLHRDGSGALLTNSKGISIRGSLASLITIETGWERAVAAGLGSLADAVVVSDLTGAVNALSFLKSEDFGIADVLILGGSVPEPIDIPAGTTALASKVSSATLGRALPALLTGCVAAESLADAESIINKFPNLTAITRDGDIVTSHRARGGSSMAATLIEINVKIGEAEFESVRATHSAERLKFEVAKSEDVLRTKQSDFEAALARLNESDARMAGIAEQMAAAGQNVKSALAEIERLKAVINEASISMASDRQELEIANNTFARATSPVEPDTEKLESLRSQVATARAIEVEARLKLRTEEERIDALTRRATDLETSAQAEREATMRNLSRREGRAKGAVLAQQIADLAFEALIKIEISIGQATTERERLERARSEREGETLSIRAQIRDLAGELEQLTTSVHRDEIARAEQRLRIEQLEQKAVEEFGIDLSTLVNEYGPANDVPTFVENESGEVVAGELIPYRREQQVKRLASAERSLALLGKINPLALEEYSALEERLKYLAEQLEDLKKSKKDLLDIIKEVDERVQEIFQQAFKDTAREFEIIFARLFPGGEGRLILTNPDDLLTTGVDVEARPPGKRIKRLSLLSGGERSLTAVALLIAIFKARPSPFYVMDEVEAALDDINLGRLLTVLAELRETSQLIIISHQKRTMEIADALYGVTMRGDGVSEVISQRIREVEVETV